MSNKVFRDMSNHIKRTIKSNTIDKAMVEQRKDTQYVSDLKPSAAVSKINAFFGDVLIDEMILGKILSLENQLDNSDKMPPIEDILEH
jgi:hypothetical protein